MQRGGSAEDVENAKRDYEKAKSELDSGTPKYQGALKGFLDKYANYAKKQRDLEKEFKDQITNNIQLLQFKDFKDYPSYLAAKKALTDLVDAMTIRENKYLKLKYSDDEFLAKLSAPGLFDKFTPKAVAQKERESAEKLEELKRTGNIPSSEQAS